MLKKQLYSAPEAELLVIRFEGNFCGTNGLPGGSEVTPFGARSRSGMYLDEDEEL